MSVGVNTLFFIGNRKLDNSDRFLAGNRQPQKKNRQPGGPILGPENLGNFQIRQIRQPCRTDFRSTEFLAPLTTKGFVMKTFFMAIHFF